ncbi:Bug family tripartite tricarboxylate transporter substrate binding protein [Hydrogenophaga sp. BPS33]|uniref:Bug family tripartite tricarboxylate transporter substrate binding protein n=1 Tax=Hydrogenophaga sp. BPS33 TaxID=2651974 RepID=UPI001357A667|nr:tripartite tricarboxylate transporter substrate binding protein [Hydrogenophaga sp. BPS33]
MKRRLALGAVGAAAAWSLSPAALSQTASSARFPSRPVRLIIPFAAGQGSDLLARALSDRLAKAWGQPVVVENRPGANGAIALQEVAKSAPDGHTLLLTSNSPLVINPNLYKKLAYDVARDFKPITMMALTDMVLVVHPSFAGRTWKEVAATIKAHPGRFSYGSPGTGSTSNLCMEIFKQEIGGDVVHAPYKGSAPAMVDLMSGTLHLMIDALPSALPHIRTGRVRAIGLTGTKPSSLAPEIPTSADAGLQHLPEGAWYGILAQGGTSEATVSAIYAQLRDILAQPDMQQRIRDQGLENTASLTPAQFADFIARDTQYWEKNTRRLGVFQSE